MKNKTRENTLQRLLLRNFIILSFLILIAILSCFLIAHFVAETDSFNIQQVDLIFYLDRLENKQFSMIDSHAFLGKNGYFEIVNSSGQTEFSTLPSDKMNTYSASEISFIQETSNQTNIELSTFTDEKNEIVYLISRPISHEKVAHQYMLLDADFRILSNTIPTDKVKLSKREFEYLTHNINNDDSRLTKFSFTAFDEKTYTAIQYDTTYIIDHTSIAIIAFFICLSAGLCLFMLLFFVYLTNKKLKLPLSLFNNIINSFSENNYPKRINYKGTKEFETIFYNFNKMVDLVEESEKIRTQLTEDRHRMMAGLSHDIGTSITVIQGFTTAIKDGIICPNDQQKYLDIILAKCSITTELVTSFSDYSKLEHPEFKMEFQRVNLVEVERELLAILYSELSFAGYQCIVSLPDEPIYCNLDFFQVRRGIQNIIYNVLKHNPPGTLISYELIRIGGFAEIIIADNGIGISDDLKENIFEPFAVANSSGTTQSSGLGLAISKKIIDCHGGTIELMDNYKDFSTAFKITLPIIKD